MKPSKTLTEIIKDSLALRQMIAIAMGVGERTVQNWAYNDNKKLVTPTVLQLVSKETGLTKGEMIAPKKDLAA